MAYSWLSIIKKHQSIIWWWLVGLLAVAALFSFTQPLKYLAKSQLLVVPNYHQVGDPYQISRTNEYLSTLLSQVIYSSSFFEATVKPEYRIDTAYFGDTLKKRLSTWRKTINVKPVQDYGIISIKVYHPDKDQADKIVQAIHYSLITNGSYYHGLGDEVTIKVIDKPVVSDWPVKPNLPLNFGVAILLGIVLGLIHIYIISASQLQTYTEVALDWPSSEAVKDMARESAIVTSGGKDDQADNDSGESHISLDNLVQVPVAAEVTINDNGEDITEQLLHGGNIDNIFAS
ncbi:MAG TPA: hypothetical protein PLP70_00075 [bacterium]|jgi:capsular polysaccharide biosynthesis protein|nr:hypothetical protein [bacterium]HQB26245.1 hypothetical protein [bacterium]